MKFLLLVAICVIVGVWLVRGAASRSGRVRDSKQDAKPTPDLAQPEQAQPDGEAMVRCLHCGVHFPRSEAIVTSAGMFCSQQHRQQHGAH